MRLACGVSVLLFFAGANYRVDFRNVAAGAGLTERFPNGGDKSKRFILETTGSGAAFLDYDNDGLLDIFLVSGEGGVSRLYHNEGHGKFSDVTTKTGLGGSGWGQGVCAADYDNDGYTDLFVTYWGQNHLYRNAGGRPVRRRHGTRRAEAGQSALQHAAAPFSTMTTMGMPISSSRTTSSSTRQPRRNPAGIPIAFIASCRWHAAREASLSIATSCTTTTGMGRSPTCPKHPVSQRRIRTTRSAC